MEQTPPFMVPHYLLWHPDPSHPSTTCMQQYCWTALLKPLSRILTAYTKPLVKFIKGSERWHEGRRGTVTMLILWVWNLISSSHKSLMKGGPAWRQSLRLDLAWRQPQSYTILMGAVAESFFTRWWGMKWYCSGIWDSSTCSTKPRLSWSAIMSPYSLMRLGVWLSLCTKDHAFLSHVLQFEGRGEWFAFYGNLTT